VSAKVSAITDHDTCDAKGRDERVGGVGHRRQRGNPNFRIFEDGEGRDGEQRERERERERESQIGLLRLLVFAVADSIILEFF
jgi:hypothetical protein